VTDPTLARQTADGRFYTQPSTGEADYVSVTTVLDMKEKPIAPWGYRKCGEFVSENLEALNLLKGDPKAIVDLVRGVPFRKSEESSQIGDQIHGLIEAYIHGNGILSAEDQATVDGLKGTPKGMWRHFLGVIERYEPDFKYTEITVFSDKYKYAGTFDWLAKLGPKNNRKITLGDTKTGKSVYPETGMQLAALFFADYAMGEDGVQFELPKAEKFAVLHTRPQSACMFPIEEIEASFKAFLGLRDVYDWKVNHSGSVVRYAPKIKVPAKAAK
jgi:hypothetical protein